MIRAFAGLAALTAILAGCVTIVTQLPPAAPMTVWDVNHYLKELHGKTVRLKGEVNNCESLTCLICDGPDREDDVCLPLSLHADSEEARRWFEELYRFATITIDARIDATCQLGYDPAFYKSKGDSPDTIVCTDRSGGIEDARVVSVDARKPASLGRFDMYKGEPLQEAGADASSRIKQFLSGLPWADQSEEELQQKLYADPEPWKGVTESYIFCECTEESCEGRWPSWSGHTDTRSPANPYICSHITRIGDNWVLS